jgi:hypothetical protein
MDDASFIESDAHRDQPMTRLTDSTIASGSGASVSAASGSLTNAAGSPLSGVPVADDRSVASAVRDALSGKQVCPFCGSQNAVSASSTTNATGPCPRCTMEDTAATRQATKARIGPWHVLQTRNPAAPGMRYATLLALVGKGQVTARSVVRGPTTHQLWRYAAHVKGLSREFGVCYSCGESIDKTAGNCSHCDRAQEPMGNPDALLESRESVVNSVASATSTAGGEMPAGDPYSIVTRHPAGSLPLGSAGSTAASASLLSHAERLRTGSDLRRRPDGRALSAMELAAALQVAPPPPPPDGHPVRTTLVTLAVVAILASVIIGYARPDLRRQAQDWSQARWGQIGQALNNFHLQKAPPADGSASADSDNSSAVPFSPTASNDPNPVGSANAPANDIPAPVSTPVPANSIQVTPSQVMPAQVAPAGNTPVNPPAEAASASVKVTPAPAQAPDPSARQSVMPDRPILVGAVPSVNEIWSLHSRGLNAEGRQDWAEAVRCYEQIELAPKDEWPSDTRIRLENAKRQLSR